MNLVHLGFNVSKESNVNAASCDGVITTSRDSFVIEYKAPVDTAFPAASIDVPPCYIVQVLWNMHVTGSNGGLFVTWGPTFCRTFYFEKDDELIGMMTDGVREIAEMPTTK